MRSRRDRRGGFVTPATLVIQLVLIAILVTGYLLLGRLGWSWWIRSLVLIGGCYALAGVMMAFWTLVEKIQEKKKPSVP